MELIFPGIPSDEAWDRHVKKVAAAMRRAERRGKCGLCGAELVDGKCPVDEERLAKKVVDLDEHRKRRASRR